MTSASVILTESHLSTPGGVPYRRYEGYPKISFKDEGNTARDRILIADDSLSALRDELLPPPRIVGNQVITDPRGKFPAFPSMVVESFEVSGMDSKLPADPMRADFAGHYERVLLIDISYKTGTSLDYDPYDPETFTEHGVDISNQLMHFPSLKTKGVADADVSSSAYSSNANAEDNKDPQLTATKSIPTIEHTFDWKNVLWPHWDNITAGLGTLNDRTLPWIANGAVDTVMFKGVSGKRLYITTSGDVVLPVWNLVLRFTQRVINEGGVQYGWNHVYRPEDGKWIKLLRANGETLYSSTTFSELFLADPPPP